MQTRKYVKVFDKDLLDFWLRWFSAVYSTVFFYIVIVGFFFYKLVLQICICWWQNTFHQNMTREHRKDISNGLVCQILLWQ